jgi:nucleoside-diphosphate-sugar epimerase
VRQRQNVLASRHWFYNIVCGKSISLNALAESIGEILGRHVRPRYEAPRPADIRHSLADISLARSFGYFPDYSLEDGLKETIRWYRGHEI